MDIFTKQPLDVRDYDVDMVPWFSSFPNDDIESVSFVVNSLAEASPALVIGPGVHPEYVLLGNNPQRFKVWLGGGTHMTDYIVSCVVHTEQDRVKEIEFKIKVRDR